MQPVKVMVQTIPWPSGTSYPPMTVTRMQSSMTSCIPGTRPCPTHSTPLIMTIAQRPVTVSNIVL